MTQATEIKALYGTSLNIAVAEQVMGWRRRTGENWDWGQWDFQVSSTQGVELAKGGVFDPDDSWTDAFKVVDALQAKGYKFGMHRSGPDEIYAVTFGEVTTYCGKDGPQAICQSALATLAQAVDGDNTPSSAFEEAYGIPS